MDLTDPKDLIRKHPPLQGVVSPLCELVRVNPHLLENVIEFALVCGIQAAYNSASKPDPEEMNKLIARSMGHYESLGD